MSIRDNMFVDKCEDLINEVNKLTIENNELKSKIAILEQKLIDITKIINMIHHNNKIYDDNKGLK